MHPSGNTTSRPDRLAERRVARLSRCPHIGARIAALAAASEILVSRTVKDLITGSGIALLHRGTHALKGVPDEWQVYIVSN